MTTPEWCLSRAAIDLVVPVEAEADSIIACFHRWIREDRLPRQPVDVATYEHVANGPGILLLGQGFQFSSRPIAEGRVLRYERQEIDPVPGVGFLAGLIREGMALAEQFVTDYRSESELGGFVLTFVDRRSVRDLPSEILSAAIRPALDVVFGPIGAALIPEPADPREPVAVRAVLAAPIHIGSTEPSSP